MTAQPPEITVKKAVKPPYELICSTAHLLKRLGMEIKEAYREAFEAAGASPFHYSVLAVLEESPRETQATIADSLGYDRSWLVGLLDELEEKGLIERRRDPADRRRHVVTLLPAGKQQARRAPGDLEGRGGRVPRAARARAAREPASAPAAADGAPRPALRAGQRRRPKA